MKHWFRQHGLTLIAIVSLAGTLTRLPYAYYQVMDWIVAGAAIGIALRARAHKKETWMWVFAGVAVVFNPVAPLYLRSDVWLAADAVAALLLLASFILVTAPRKNIEHVASPN